MSILRRMTNLFRRSQIDRDIADELQSHIDLRIDANIASGMSPDAARRDALLRFGNPTSTRERTAASDTTLSFAGLARDLRYAFRQLRRSPGFAVTAILTLALGIGTNVVVFGVLNAAIQRQMGIAAPHEIWQIIQRQPKYISQSYPDYLDYKTQNSTFTDIAAYHISQAALNVQGTARSVWDVEASGNYFDTLGIQPEIGRFFHAGDEHGVNSAPYIVLSDTCWRSRFGADPRVIGTTAEVNKHPYTILGVAPRNFHGTELFLWPDFWVPMVNAPQIDGYSYLDKRFNHGLFVIGRLKPHVTMQQALDNLNAIASHLAKAYPQTDDGMGARLVRPGMFGDQLGDVARNFLIGILLLALLTLTAAWVNLAGIIAARTADRARELAVRIAIGSTRWRLLQQVLAEAALLSLAGGLAGAFAATTLLRWLSLWHPIPLYPIQVTVAADARVWAFAVVLALAGGVLPALLTARQIWKTDAMQAMKGSSQQVLRRLSLRDLLLAVQVTLCALLVTCALVALRGMARSLHAPLGFNPQGVTLAQTEMKMSDYTDASALPVEKRLISRAEEIPGVTAVGTIDGEPLDGGGSSTPFYPSGTTDFRSSNSAGVAKYFTISPGYLNAAQMRLLAGRDFTWHDDANAPHVVMINQTMARMLFGNAPAVGRHFAEPGPTEYEVVGVVEDGKYDSLTEDPRPAMFWPLGQNNESECTLVVRSPRPPSEVAAALNSLFQQTDASLPVTIVSWPEALALVLFPARAATVALGVMGLLAAMLAVTGIFGMASYSVSKRLRELGIRVALGAHRAQIMRAALGRAVILLLSGSLAGLILGVLASRLLALLVYEATSRDPLVLAGAIAAMCLIGLVATWIPARRALAIDPARLLRED